MSGEASKVVAARIRTLRGRANLTQEALAERLNVTPTCVSYWETHRRMVKVDDLPGIAAALGVSVMDLLPSAFAAPPPIQVSDEQLRANLAGFLATARADAEGRGQEHTCTPGLIGSAFGCPGCGLAGRSAVSQHRADSPVSPVPTDDRSGT